MLLNTKTSLPSVSDLNRTRTRTILSSSNSIRCASNLNTTPQITHSKLTPTHIPTPIDALTKTNPNTTLQQPTTIERKPDTNKTRPTTRPNTSLKIAIIGYGNFGQFLARTFAEQGHQILAHSRTDYTHVAQSMGAKFFSDPHDLCEQHPDVVLLCSSILSAERVLSSLPLDRLRRSTLFADVLSVKEFPRNLMLTHLPSEFDILCTHPMFGPESGKNGWAGLPFVYEKVRVGEGEERVERCCRFLEIFERAGCRMVEMSCEEHDETAAEIQFLTHTVGRVLAKLKLKSTSINTKGYETLLNLVQNTCSDSFDLYNGLFMYNKNSSELIEKLDGALDATKKELFERLHGEFRKQLMRSDN